MYFVETNGARSRGNTFIISFFTLCVAYFFLSATSEYLLISDNLFYDFFGGNVNDDRISELIIESGKWKLVTYLVLPVFLMIKLFLVTICFSIGTLVLGIDNSFRKLFQLTVMMEYIFLIPPVIKLFWFSLYQTDYALEDLQYFSPLSVFSLFNSKEVEPWLAHPLQLLNVFELLYWFALAYHLREITCKSFTGSLGFVASTYGIGLLIWVVFVMFLVVSLT